MAQTPEIQRDSEVVVTTEYPRFRIGQLATLETRNNNWLGVTPHFPDGSELLSLTQLRARNHYNHTHGKQTDPEDLIRRGSPVEVLDRKMSSHWIARSIFFNSPRTPMDAAGVKNAQELLDMKELSKEQQAAGKTPYKLPKYTPEVAGSIVEGVAAQQELRTRKLLGDFERVFNEVEDTPVWLRGTSQSAGAAAIFAAQLAGFTIHGSGSETVIEPIVLSRDGDRRGLLPTKPEDFYVYPQVTIRPGS